MTSKRRLPRSALTGYTSRATDRATIQALKRTIYLRFGTQQEAADYFGVQRVTVTRWLNGKAGIPCAVLEQISDPELIQDAERRIRGKAARSHLQYAEELAELQILRQTNRQLLQAQSEQDSARRAKRITHQQQQQQRRLGDLRQGYKRKKRAPSGRSELIVEPIAKPITASQTDQMPAPMAARTSAR